MGGGNHVKRLRILLWAPHGAGNHYWGPGTSAFRLYSGQSKSEERKYTLSLAHGFKEHKKYDVYKSQHYISNVESKTAVQMFIFLVKSWFWIKKNHSDFDIVHVLGAYHYSFLPALWFERCGVHSVIKMTTINSGLTHSSRLSRVLGLDSYRRNNKDKITAFIAISSAIARELAETGVPSEKIHFIPNGVNTGHFKPAVKKIKIRQELGLENIATILFTGSISERKNPFLLAKSFAKLKTECQLLIVGPPREGSQEQDKIISYLEEFKPGNIHLIPHTEDIRIYYQAADLFVLPSTNEGLSNSLLEAQSSGLPALVTKISGSEDVVKTGFNGDFITLDLDNISSTLNTFLSDIQNAIFQGHNARQHMVKNYDHKMILRTHIDLFKALLN